MDYAGVVKAVVIAFLQQYFNYIIIFLGVCTRSITHKCEACYNTRNLVNQWILTYSFIHCSHSNTITPKRRMCTFPQSVDRGIDRIKCNIDMIAAICESSVASMCVMATECWCTYCTNSPILLPRYSASEWRYSARQN